MTALTHAVFDTTTSEQVGDPYPNAAAALAAASALGGPAKGYVVDLVRWKPSPAAVKDAIERTEDEDGFTLPRRYVEEQIKPEAPVAAVAKDPEGPGLFD
jgi:hypothetical protein